MVWCALAVSAYSFFLLFSSESGRELSLSLVRLAVAMVFLVAAHSQNEAIVSAAILMNVVAVLVAMVILRKEVQIKNDEL